MIVGVILCLVYTFILLPLLMSFYGIDQLKSLDSTVNQAYCEMRAGRLSKVWQKCKRKRKGKKQNVDCFPNDAQPTFSNVLKRYQSIHSRVKSDQTPSVLSGTFQALPHHPKDFQWSLVRNYSLACQPNELEIFRNLWLSLNKLKKRPRSVSSLKFERNHQNATAGAHLLLACGRPFKDRHDAFGGQRKKRRSQPTTSLCNRIKCHAGAASHWQF